MKKNTIFKRKEPELIHNLYWYENKKHKSSLNCSYKIKTKTSVE